jgi:hypothetical protein
VAKAKPHPQRMTDADAVKAFVLAGNSRFTIVSTATGQRFTFRVRKADGKPAFVQLLSGSNNETDYEFLGTIFNENAYVHGRKSRIGERALSAKAFDFFIKRLLRGQMHEGIQFWHEGRCGRCSRALTDPVSIESGFGPECIRYQTRHDFMVAA